MAADLYVPNEPLHWYYASHVRQIKAQSSEGVPIIQQVSVMVCPDVAHSVSGDVFEHVTECWVDVCGSCIVLLAIIIAVVCDLEALQ